jgi:hypothetical protein
VSKQNKKLDNKKPFLEPGLPNNHFEDLSFHFEILKLEKTCEKWSSKEKYVHILSSW